ncbi:MAG TPA: hypothetical protein VG013_28100, partial [Gemmataceae bacterium]|nr:hypothetical protein [Gemmataceae bacterium]
RLFTGRQANTTLVTVGRIAYALGKEVVHTLRDLPATRVRAAGKKQAAAKTRHSRNSGQVAR